MTDHNYVLQGATGDWEIVVGMEVHAQVASQSKLFSGSSTDYGAEPNTQVSLVDAAMPGMLPVINAYCVEQAVRTGLGLNAKINTYSRFDRKNYFYPDLPQGYQISQFQFPIVGEGEIECERDDGSLFTVGIERLHLEQDAGKSIHDLDPNATYVDLNRSGVALMEIVSRPHIRTPDEAAAYMKAMRTIVRYLGTCGGDMEKGQMRADVNVSICRPGQYEKFRADGDFKHLGTRCEIKNVNSMRFIQQAIEYEARRQIDLVEDGGTVEQQTRLFDANKGVTRSMRSKEEAHDYRYFPCPDLLPLEIPQSRIDEIKAELPELPADKRKRFLTTLKLSGELASGLAADRRVAEATESQIWKWLVGEFGEKEAFLASIKDVSEMPLEFDIYPPNPLELLEKYHDDFEEDRLAGGRDADHWRNRLTDVADNYGKIIAQHVFSYANETGEDSAEVISRIDLFGLRRLVLGLETDRKISSQAAKVVMLEMMKSGKLASEIADENDLWEIDDADTIKAVIDQLIADNPEQAAQVKEKPKAVGWFVGQVMKAMQGKANPKAVNDILKQRLGL